MTELIIDRAVLDELRAIDGDLLREVVDIFLADVPLQLADVRRTIASRDAGAIWQAAHRLKGTALGVGARQLAQAAGAVEHAARDGDLETAAAAAATIDGAFDAARAALEDEQI